MRDSSSSGPSKFIRSLYQELLNREPDESELSTWVERAGHEPAEEIYYSFAECEERRHARPAAMSSKLFVPPGHFYSPIVDVAELLDREAGGYPRELADSVINFRDSEQVALAQKFATLHPLISMVKDKHPDFRYHYINSAYGAGDAFVLAAMMMTLRPARIIEVGSGYSSAMMLDINEKHLAWGCEQTFVEPYPALLESLISADDRSRVNIIASPVQNVPLEIYDKLQENDILFIDNTHIVKTGSDVLHHFEKVLPRLRSGVIIHIHDIFDGFEYPREWIFEDNRSWNELYYVRAFLTHNGKYEVLFFNDYMAKRHADLMVALTPNFMLNGGGSIWLRKM